MTLQKTLQIYFSVDYNVENSYFKFKLCDDVILQFFRIIESATKKNSGVRCRREHLHAVRVARFYKVQSVFLFMMLKEYLI